MMRLSQAAGRVAWVPHPALSAGSLEGCGLYSLGLIAWPGLWLTRYTPERKAGGKRPLLEGLIYLPLERGHIGPGVGGRVIALHSIQVIVVVTARHRVDVPAHDTHTQVGVLLLQRLGLEPAVVPRVVP